MFAIRSKRDKRWVYGTDYRYSKPKQRLSHENVKIYSERIHAKSDMILRQINMKNYEIVEVELTEVKKVEL